MTIAEIATKAASHENRARYLRERLKTRLVYSAFDRCSCGASMAYDAEDDENAWDCSAIMTGIASQLVAHSPRKRFAKWEKKVPGAIYAIRK